MGEQDLKHSRMGSVEMLAQLTSVEERMTVPLMVCGRETKALVDTGAVYSLVDGEWLRSIGIPHESCAVEVHGFGENKSLDIIGSVNLRVSVHGIDMLEVKFYVVNALRSRGVKVLLGENFLRKNELSIDVRNGVLTKPTKTGSVSIVIREGHECKVVYRTVECFARSSMEIAPGEMSQMEIEFEQAGVMGGCDSCRGTKGQIMLIESDSSENLQILPGLYDSADKSAVVLARPLASGKAKIRKGMSVGVISTVYMSAESELSGEVEVGVTTLKSCGACEESFNLRQGIDLSHFDSNERERIYDMLGRVGDVFSRGDHDMGQLKVESHTIELTDATPIYQKPRRFNDKVTDSISQQCGELELMDIIEPSKSSWSSPVVPILKKDGTLRLCVDYRRLNCVTKPDRYPLPNLIDNVYGLSDMKFFTTLDLVRGYYQLPLSEGSRECTAFSTPGGLFQFKRLPFGLRNAPAAFQRAMQEITQEFPRQQVIVYIDDVLIMSRTFEEHLTLVEKLLSTLEGAGVKIKPSKCTWFQSSVQYLGHLVGKDGIQKSPEFVEKVLKFERPQTVGELRQFLGLANFQRKFVARFSEIQKPLSELTGGRNRRKRLNWTQQMEDSFEQLKTELAEDILLAYPEYGDTAKPLQLFVDASLVGAGACLCQEQRGEKRIIIYASTTFNKAECRYSTIERELAALRWAVKALRPFLMGSSFEIHTDHQPLVYLNNMRILDSRLARTHEDLAGFDFKIVYIPGKDNTAADHLSRPYVTTAEKVTNDSCNYLGKLPEGVRLHSKVDGGGDSLFESLIRLIAESPSGFEQVGVQGSGELRTLLVGELLKHPAKYGVNLSRDTRRSLRLMASEGQVPSFDLLRVFAQIYSCHVLVHFSPEKPVWFSPGYELGDEAPVFHLQCLAGIHFNPAVASDAYESSKSPQSTSSSVEREGTSSLRGLHSGDSDYSDASGFLVQCDQLPRTGKVHCGQHVAGHMACISVDFGEFEGVYCWIVVLISIV